MASDDIKRWHRMSVAKKLAYTSERLREPPVSCPRCETKTQPHDLMNHLERCKGPPKPHHAMRWINREQAKDMLGISDVTLWRWSRKGLVRSRGGGNDSKREYLLRDVARRAANHRIMKGGK